MADIPEGPGPGSYQVKENANYHEAMMQSLILTDQEAAQDGCLQEYEDLIDSWWASIPIKEKKEIQVYDAQGEDQMTALEAWGRAERIQPDPDLPPSKRKLDRKNKSRALRKKQILVDVLSELQFLFKRPPISAHDDADREFWDG